MSKTIEDKEFWEKQIKKLNVSGLSRTQYCRENGINYHRLGYWIKRLCSASPTFIPIEVKKPESTSYKTLCTIELRGHVLKIHDPSALLLLLERMS